MLLKQATLYSLGRGLPGAVSLLLISIYTRFLSPEEYGAYAATLAWVTIARTALFQWLEMSVFRFLPDVEGEASDAVLATARRIFARLTVLVVLGSLVLQWAPIRPSDPLLGIAAVVALVATAWFELNLSILQRRQLVVKYGSRRLAKSLVELTIGTGLAFWGAGAPAPMLGLCGGILLSGLFTTHIRWPPGGARADSTLGRQFVAYGLPLAAAAGATTVVAVADRVMLAGMRGDAAAGIYSAAYDMAFSSVTLVMIVVHLAAYPLALSAFEKGGGPAVEQQLRRNAQAILAIAVPTTLSVAWLAEDFAAILFGEAFRDEAASILPVIAFSALVSGTRSYVFDLAFQITKQTAGQARILFVTAITNVVLNVVLIERYSVLGAAYATLISYVLALLLSASLGRSLIRVNCLNADLFKTIISGMTAFGALYYLAPASNIGTLVLKLACGAGLYGALLYCLNALDSRDRVRRLVRRYRPGVRKR